MGGRLLEGQGLTLSIVIPAYTEAENLDYLLPRIRQVAAEIAPDAEILVVDTLEATDDTEQICRKHGARYLRRENSDDFGNAIRTGINNSAGRYVITMDADGSHEPSFLRELWNEREGHDVVIASRFMPGGSTDNPFVLTAMSRVLNFLFRIWAGQTVYDASNGLRLYDGARLRDLSLACSHFDIEQELLVKMTGNDPERVLEIPYHFRERRAGRSKRNLVQFSLNYLRTLARLRRLHREARRRAGGH